MARDVILEQQAAAKYENPKRSLFRVNQCQMLQIAHRGAHTPKESVTCDGAIRLMRE